ncbi:MAG: CHRD domain-containing protein, partial [Actinomycetota bacterium]|nr:CHRD domain-containing protein [Actinomycetota bacterium]
MHLPRSLLLAAAPALVAAGLFVSAGTAGADSQPLVASLDGAQEVPGPGDTDGSGSATVTVDSETDELCY